MFLTSKSVSIIQQEHTGISFLVNKPRSRVSQGGARTWCIRSIMDFLLYKVRMEWNYGKTYKSPSFLLVTSGPELPGYSRKGTHI